MFPWSLYAHGDLEAGRGCKLAPALPRTGHWPEHLLPPHSRSLSTGEQSSPWGSNRRRESAANLGLTPSAPWECHQHCFLRCSNFHSTFVLFFFFLRFYLFSETGQGSERGEKHRCEKHQSVAFHRCPARDRTTTQARALTGNRTSDLSLCRTMSNGLSLSGHAHSTLVLKTALLSPDPRSNRVCGAGQRG